MLQIIAKDPDTFNHLTKFKKKTSIRLRFGTMYVFPKRGHDSSIRHSDMSVG